MAVTPDVEAERRRLGSYYTPSAVTRYMAHACLDSLDAAMACSPATVRILDPSCGDGAFLIELFDQLCRTREEQRSESLTPADRLQIVRDQLFGVDVDPNAVEGARARLRSCLLGDDGTFSELERVLEANVRCGDALLGEGFSTNRRQQRSLLDLGLPAANDKLESQPVDWGVAFPAVADEGGFDLIIGNPPYLREKNRKKLFDRIANAPWAKRWRQGRMDLWYYFLHRGLDLLKPGGCLSFIVNSYWTASTGARRLIERLAAETDLREVVLLGKAAVFPGVMGRHLILRLSRRESSQTTPAVQPESHPLCRIVSLVEESDVFAALDALARPTDAAHPPDDGDSVYTLRQEQIFQQGRMIFDRPAAGDVVLQGRRTLGEYFETRQGLAENPPSINLRHCRGFPEQFTLSEGVFVLTSPEIERLTLNERECGLLRPYYETCEVGRYALPAAPTRWVLYLTEQTAPDLGPFPHVAAHLQRFRCLLDPRRETQLGRRAWWHLHWPREERVFTEPRIVCVQMGRVPQAVFVERPAFFGFSINLVLETASSPFSLPVLTAILNSQRAARWFNIHAKRRGVNLEINGCVLQQFPLPEGNPVVERALRTLVEQRQALVATASAGGEEEAAHRLDKEIEQLVSALYGVTSP